MAQDDKELVCEKHGVSEHCIAGHCLDCEGQCACGNCLLCYGNNGGECGACN